MTNALEHDAEAIGLFRSEFLFMDAIELPSEEEQFQAYRKVATALKGAPVIIRTLDVGGDKEIPYLDMEKEENPFMGFRAVRYCLENADQYKVQLRALLRAGAFGDVKIMVPLVTCVEEVRAVKALVEECKAELEAEGRSTMNIERSRHDGDARRLLIADKLAGGDIFRSAPTTSSAQPCAAATITSPTCTRSTIRPAPLDQEHHRERRSAPASWSVCAARPLPTCCSSRCDSFGLEEFSMSAPSILRARKTISQWTKAECDELAEKALACSTAAEVKELLEANAR